MSYPTIHPADFTIIEGSDANDRFEVSTENEAFYGRGGADIYEFSTRLVTLPPGSGDAFLRLYDNKGVNYIYTDKKNSGGDDSILYDFSAREADGFVPGFTSLYSNMRFWVDAESNLHADTIVDGQRESVIVYGENSDGSDVGLRINDIVFHESSSDGGSFNHVANIGGYGYDTNDADYYTVDRFVSFGSPDLTEADFDISQPLRGDIRDFTTYGLDLVAEEGADTVYGTAFGDRITSDGTNAATFYGYSGSDRITGSEGNDTIYGGNGNDGLFGEDGDDTLYGEDGDDEIFAGQGVDTVNGGNGNDLIFGDLGNDILDGGNGNDEIWGGQGGDEISGGNGNDVISGGENNDILYGNKGDDQISGGAGNDYLYGSSGEDLLVGGEGYDRLSGGTGDDELFGGTDNDRLYGSSGNDLLSGDEGIDQLYGGADDDFLSGGAGNDRLYGGEGDDILLGGDGYNRLYGGDGGDTYMFSDALDGKADWAYGFDASEGDTIDVSDLVEAYDPLTDAIGDFIKVTEIDNYTRVQVDVDGQGTDAEFVTVVRLDGVTGLDTVEELIGNGTIVV